MLPRVKSGAAHSDSPLLTPDELGLAVRNHGTPLEVRSVEVSADGAKTWHPAELGPADSPLAWRSWNYVWLAEPGDYELCCRVTDDAGNTQPITRIGTSGAWPTTPSNEFGSACRGDEAQAS
jgi:hypothetical protein